ncbi:hypothetical protein OG760_00185 [Streptomyces sp. NBC_00963]|uniref:hypothetical protein n=1 Tax=Streptomyces sp. NBC_00963 TaxID=2903697 RepID=UPI0038699318|nr:hypothetical protein OG760_00185 [Streptomyces sp. NBC_00963]
MSASAHAMARGSLPGSGPVRSGHTVFSARRRLLRPGEEYREPTAQEWQDFLAHFELRSPSAPAHAT